MNFGFRDTAKLIITTLKRSMLLHIAERRHKNGKTVTAFKYIMHLFVNNYISAYLPLKNQNSASLRHCNLLIPCHSNTFQKFENIFHFHSYRIEPVSVTDTNTEMRKHIEMFMWLQSHISAE